MYDVIIVGGGPGGSSAGYFLASQGLNCLILDSAHFPRDKPCGGGLTTRILDRFPFIKEFIEISNFSTFIHYNQEEYTISHTADIPNLFFVQRIKFDHDLLNLAKKSNCTVREGARVENIQEETDQVRVILSDKTELITRFVLGADGINSTIRKKSGLEKYWNKNTMALIFTNEIEVGESIMNQYYSSKRDSHIHLFVGKSYGYGWLFAKQKHINSGYGELYHNHNGHLINQHYNDYLAYCLKLNLFPKEAMRPTAKSWLLQSGGPMKNYATNRVYLIGDAAGFTNPMSGEGVIYAIWSAQIISNLIISYSKGQLSLDRIQLNYMQICEREFRAELQDIASFNIKMQHFMKYIFRLANHDPQLADLIFVIISGDKLLSYPQAKRKIIKRIIIGIINGKIWRK